MIRARPGRYSHDVPLPESRWRAAVRAARPFLLVKAASVSCMKWRIPVGSRNVSDLKRNELVALTTPDVAERCLHHKIGGVRGKYDKHEYLEQKRDALQKLADLVDRIVDGNVVPFVARSR
jgi:hypothetical protein